jgi:hypothetical protein
MAGMFSLLLNLSVTAMVFPVWGHELLFRTMLLWCIPILINGAAALVLSARIRNFRYLSSVLFMLPVFWMLLFSGEVVVNWMTSVQLLGLMGLTVLSAGIFTVALIFQANVLRKGGVLIGT